MKNTKYVKKYLKIYDHKTEDIYRTIDYVDAKGISHKINILESWNEVLEYPTIDIELKSIFNAVGYSGYVSYSVNTTASSEPKYILLDFHSGSMASLPTDAILEPNAWDSIKESYIALYDFLLNYFINQGLKKEDDVCFTSKEFREHVEYNIQRSKQLKNLLKYTNKANYPVIASNSIASILNIEHSKVIEAIEKMNMPFSLHKQPLSFTISKGFYLQNGKYKDMYFLTKDAMLLMLPFLNEPLTGEQQFKLLAPFNEYATYLAEERKAEANRINGDEWDREERYWN